MWRPVERSVRIWNGLVALPQGVRGVQGSLFLTPLEDLVRFSSVLQKRKRNPKCWYF